MRPYNVLAWGMQPVPSPCLKICVYDPALGLCRGCKRTLDEIARWGGMDDRERLRVLAALERRNVSGL